MKLHLPKVLLTALMTTIVGLSPYAAGETVSVDLLDSVNIGTWKHDSNSEEPKNITLVGGGTHSYTYNFKQALCATDEQDLTFSLTMSVKDSTWGGGNNPYNFLTAVTFGGSTGAFAVGKFDYATDKSLSYAWGGNGNTQAFINGTGKYDSLNTTQATNKGILAAETPYYVSDDDPILFTIGGTLASDKDGTYTLTLTYDGASYTVDMGVVDDINRIVFYSDGSKQAQITALTLTGASTATSYIWAGTTGANTWSATSGGVWTSGTSKTTARDTVTFDESDVEKVVAIGGSVVANEVIVNDDYTFEGTVASDSVTAKKLSIAEGKTLTLNVKTSLIEGFLESLGDRSSLVVNDVLTIANVSGNEVLAVNDNSSITTGENGYINYSDANVEVTLEANTTLKKNFQFTGGLIINGKGWENGRKDDRYIYVKNGKSLIVDGALDLVTTVHMEIEGGHVEADSLNMGHPTDQNAHYTGKLTMKSGSLKLGAITFRKTNGSYANKFDVTGGTLEFTAENVLNKQVGAEHAIVNITGSGSADNERVTLKATETAWTIDGNGYTTMPTIGNVTIDAANTKLITFKNASLSGNIVNNAQLAIGAVSSDSVCELTLNEGSNLTLNDAVNLTVSAITGSGGVTGTADTVLTLSSAEDYSYSGVMSGAIALKKEGSGTLTLKGNNTYTGGTTVSGGTLKIGSNNTVAGTGGVLVEKGAKLDLNGQEGLYQSVVTLAGGATLLNSNSTGLDATKRQMKGLTLTGAAEVDIANSMGIIAGNYNSTTLDLGGFTLTKKGAGTFYMVNTSGTEAGLIDVQTGNIQIGTSGYGANNTTTLSKVVFNLAEGTGINLVSGANLTAKAITGSGGVDGSTNSNTSLTLSSDQDNIYSGAISNRVTLNKEGSGTLTLSGNNTYSRGTTINNGKVIVAAGSSLGSGAVAVNSSATLELQVDGTFANAISGTGGVIVDTDGTLTLSGNNTYTGTTTVSGGKVVVSGSGRLGKGAVTIANAEVELTGANNNTTKIGQKSSKVTINGGGKLTLKGQDALGYNDGSLGTLVLSGSEGTATLNIQDIASLTLTTNVEMKGNSQITGEKFNTFGTGFTVSGSNNIIDAATLELRKKWNVDVLAGGKLEISSKITDHSDHLEEAQLIKKGAGILVLSGSVANEYTSATTIEAGVLQLKKAGALGDGAVEIQSAGTLELSGADVTVSSLAVDGGKVQTNSNQLTVSGATTVTSKGGTMQGAVQLNSLSVDGKLKIGDGSTKGVIISNRNAQTTGTLGGTITSDAANTTISLAGAGVDNKAIISNALIDIMEESTFKLSHAVVADTSCITDAAAKLIVTNVQMDVTVGTNATKAESFSDGVTLQQMGGSDTVNVSEGTKVLAISSTLMDTVTVSGSGLTINLNGLKDFDLTRYDYVALSFTNAGKTAASFSTTDLGVNIAYAGSILSAPVYFDTTESSNGNGNVTTLYVGVTSDFIAAVPEPTTTTLSLLALAGLAARRRRK